MRVYSAKSKSVPFPKSGFQKWDVITPKDPENYGKQYVVIDYARYEYSIGGIDYYYTLESLHGRIYEQNLDKYEKLYSKKREVALNIHRNFEYDIKSLLKARDNIQERLDVDTSLLDEGIERIKAFLKILERIN